MKNFIICFLMLTCSFAQAQSNAAPEIFDDLTGIYSIEKYDDLARVKKVLIDDVPTGAKAEYAYELSLSLNTDWPLPFNRHIQHRLIEDAAGNLYASYEHDGEDLKISISRSADGLPVLKINQNSFDPYAKNPDDMMNSRELTGRRLFAGPEVAQTGSTALNFLGKERLLMHVTSEVLQIYGDPEGSVEFSSEPRVYKTAVDKTASRKFVFVSSEAKYLPSSKWLSFKQNCSSVLVLERLAWKHLSTFCSHNNIPDDERF